MRSVERYIHDVCKGLNLSADTRATIREELAAHINDAVAASAAEGVPLDAAADGAIRSLGDVAELRSHYRCAYRQEHATRTLGRMLGLGAFVAMLIAACAIGSSAPIFDTFWCGEAAIFIALGPLCLTSSNRRMRTVLAAAAAPFRMAIDDCSLDYAASSAILRRWAFAAVGCGAWAAVFGVILTCLRADDLAAIGPVLAFAILGLLYGLILAGVLWSLAGSLPQGADAPIRTAATSRGRRIIAAAAFFGVVAGTARMLGVVSAEAAGFIDLISALFIIGGSGSLLIATLGIRDAIALFGRETPAARRVESVRYLGRYSLVVGVIGTLLGFVIVLANLSDPNRLLVSTALALVTMLYGLTGWLLSMTAAGPRESDDKTDRPIDVGVLRPA